MLGQVHSHFRTQFLFGVVVASLFLSACFSSKNRRPDWVDRPSSAEGSAVGAASYEIFGEIKAREKAVMKALLSLALQKGGTVDLESSVENRQVLSRHNASESFNEQASITTRAIVSGKEIPVNAQIKAFWKDVEGRRIWVLLVEE
ncbi:hypothetical protein MNBD_NITROSPIRAE01-735 [hydrothermal vent metagenome]|uniref:Lipoprotein n=1 Tax=hydrothermal vent metagenome TaxID=652676 RepID=A0A3B1CJV0_9ZZZZ